MLAREGEKENLEGIWGGEEYKQNIFEFQNCFK